jgi:muconolactone D-isomerase
MLYMVRFDVHQPVDMSTEQLFRIWNEEAKAALGAIEAGAIVGLWKVAGQRTVFAVCEFPDHHVLDQALAGLPIIQQMGGSVTTQAFPIYPYTEFAEDVGKAVEGG